jgi:hypothetical protein
LKDEILLVLCNMGAIARAIEKLDGCRQWNITRSTRFSEAVKEKRPALDTEEKTSIGDIRLDSCGILDRGRNMIMVIPMWT